MSFFGNRRQVDQPATPVTQPQPTPQPVSQPLSQPVGFETVLGASAVLEGTFSSAGNVRLDGAFTGTLEIGGNVLVGETAKINADINARNISIAGAVRGNVKGKKVQLLRTGRVWGDINAQALTTEEGAFIDGKITMAGHEAEPVQALETVEDEPEFVAALEEENDVLEDSTEPETLFEDDAVADDGPQDEWGSDNKLQDGF